MSCGSDGVLKAHDAEDFSLDATQEFTPTNSDQIHAFALANQVRAKTLRSNFEENLGQTLSRVAALAHYPTCNLPQGDVMALGREDGTVALHKYPSLEYEADVARFTLAVNTVAFSSSDKLLATGGK